MRTRSISEVNITNNNVASVTSLGEELFQKGKAEYGTCFDTSRNLLLGSLYAQLTDLDIFPKPFEPGLEVDYRESVDHLLLTTDRTALVEKISPQNRQRLAETLRWVGHCYQNLDTFNSQTEENIKRFKFLYHTAEALLNLEESQEAKKELVELYYNSWPFMYLLEHPDDFLGANTVYDKVLALDSSPAMRSRIGNMRYLNAKKALEPISAAEYHSTVIVPYSELETHDFTYALFHHNWASLLKDETKSQEAEAALKPTLDYMEAETAQLHPYFSIFYQTLKEIKLTLGQTEEAKQAQLKSRNHAQRNPDTPYNKKILEEELIH